MRKMVAPNYTRTTHRIATRLCGAIVVVVATCLVMCNTAHFFYPAYRAWENDDRTGMVLDCYTENGYTQRYSLAEFYYGTRNGSDRVFADRLDSLFRKLPTKHNMHVTKRLRAAITEVRLGADEYLVWSVLSVAGQPLVDGGVVCKIHSEPVSVTRSHGSLWRYSTWQLQGPMELYIYPYKPYWPMLGLCVSIAYGLTYVVWDLPMSLLRRCIARRRAARGCCRGCGYPQQVGVNICPECGVVNPLVIGVLGGV